MRGQGQTECYNGGSLHFDGVAQGSIIIYQRE